MRTIRSVLTSLTRSPVKSTVTLSTVGLGVGVLIFALSISGAFSRLVSEQLERDGLVVMVANVERDEEGELQQVRPPQFDGQVIDALRTGVSGAVAASPVAFTPWTEYVVGGNNYRFRSVVGVNEDYLDVMGLEVVAGSAFTAEDVAQGVREALVSVTMAEVLFGSPVEALGQVIQPPARTQAAGGGGGGGRRFTPPTYTVRGVFGDPSEIQRRAYGVGDMIVPATSAFPVNLNSRVQAFMQGFLNARIALRVQGGRPGDHRESGPRCPGPAIRRRRACRGLGRPAGRGDGCPRRGARHGCHLLAGGEPAGLRAAGDRLHRHPQHHAGGGAGPHARDSGRAGGRGVTRRDRPRVLRPLADHGERGGADRRGPEPGAVEDRSPIWSCRSSAAPRRPSWAAA